MKKLFLNKKRQILANILVASMVSSVMVTVALFYGRQSRNSDFEVMVGVSAFVASLLFMIVVSMQEKE